MLILKVGISCWRGILVILMEEVVDVVENIDMARSCASVVRVVEVSLEVGCWAGLLVVFLQPRSSPRLNRRRREKDIDLGEA
jgi:hypothetical protein